MIFITTLFVFGSLVLVVIVFAFVKTVAQERRDRRPAPSLPAPPRPALQGRDARRLAAARAALTSPSLDPAPLLDGVYVAPTYAERHRMLDALITHHPDASETTRAAAAALDPDATGDGADELAQRAFDWVARHHGAGPAMDDLISRANLYSQDPGLFTHALDLDVVTPATVAPAFSRLGLQHGDEHAELFTAYTTRVSGDTLARAIDSTVQNHFMYNHDAARSRAFLLIGSELSSYAPDRVLELLLAVDSEHLEKLSDALLAHSPPPWLADVMIDAITTLPTHLTGKLVDRLDEVATLEHVPRLTKLTHTSRLATIRAALEDTIRTLRIRHDDGSNAGMLTFVSDSPAGGLSPAHGAGAGDLSGASPEDE